MLLPGDLAHRSHCLAVVDETVEHFRRIDVLVFNAAFQATYISLEEIPDEDWLRTMNVNVTAMFRICQSSLPHMSPGSSIINTSSVNSDIPTQSLLAYSTNKGAIANFTAGMAQLLGEKGIRVNSVAPGPIWTPLIASTMSSDDVKSFGSQTPLKRLGQPVEVAPIYVLLASDESSYVSGSRLGVTGGKPML